MIASTSYDFAALMIDGLPMIGFRFEDGHYLLNVLLFDEGNRLVVQIVDNELVYSMDPWDIEFVGTRLVIRAQAGSIFIDMVFEPPDAVRFERDLLRNGVEVYIRPEYFLIVNTAQLFQRCSVMNVPIGFKLGADTVDLYAIQVPDIGRYGIDRLAELAWAREQLGEVGSDLEGEDRR